MPEYEYRCRNCQQVFSIERPMSVSSDEALTSCNQCGSNDLARIWGANFVGVGVKGQPTSPAAPSEMCASNPAQPKSCCPCS